MVQEFFGPQFPPVGELVRNIDIVFVNSNEIIEKPRPLSHKVKYIGGAALPKAKPVTKVIPTKNIPLNIRKNFVEAFKKFPEITFMWKYDVQNDEGNMFLNVTNVHILKWMPQTDLLGNIKCYNYFIIGDRRVIGFISHMGLNSLLEASYAGIPILAVPIFSDQAHNAQIGVDRGTTVIVNKDELTTDNIENALKKLLYDTRYRDNAIRISSLLKNKPEDVKSKFVNWVEYAAQHKRLHKKIEASLRDKMLFCTKY
uniref:glucuronosyltransferase n=1 Tax=Heterorhabditis bacteriophora TaxID=37862 RepID=A0A1I7WE82_HETBA